MYFNSRGRQPFSSTERFKDFNSRPHEVDSINLESKIFNYFQLTTSRGGRQQNTVCIHIFQLTTSRGGRPMSIMEPVQHGISTHDLTRRSTSMRLETQPVSYISTHTLTRGRQCLYVIFHELCFNSHPPHERGRPLPTATFCVITNISTHDLTKRSTNPNYIYIGGSIFQLTTSRGGRHSLT